MEENLIELVTAFIAAFPITYLMEKHDKKVADKEDILKVLEAKIDESILYYKDNYEGWKITEEELKQLWSLSGFINTNKHEIPDSIYENSKNFSTKLIDFITTKYKVVKSPEGSLLLQIFYDEHKTVENELDKIHIETKDDIKKEIRPEKLIKKAKVLNNYLL